MMAVAIYIRVSTEEQQQRQSIRTQIEFGERYCQLHGLDVHRIYSDEIYEHILFDGHCHHSILSCPGMEKKAILVSGASKSFAWTGGRIGWALFPTREDRLYLFLIAIQ